VGQVFLPRTDFGAQETCRTIVETEVLRMGYYIYGWRHVPVDIERAGREGQRDAARDRADHDLQLQGRGRGDLRARALRDPPPDREGGGAAQVPRALHRSLSCRSIIYKGMMLAEQVAEFYPDLKDERFESAFAIYHQRYSTNTFPQWWLAQPFRMLAHNGEINTLKGNVNWMKSHEIRMASSAFGDHGRGHQADRAHGGLVGFGGARRGVRGAGARGAQRADGQDHAGARSWSKQARENAEAWRDMYAYCNSVMEPWDGPAALADDRRALGLRRAGPQRLRPMRYVVTGDGLVIAGSEAGMVPSTRPAWSRRARSARGRCWPSTWPRASSPRHRDQGQAGRGAALRRVGRQDHRLDERAGGVTEAPLFEGAELRKRQIAAGYTMEELEQILAPMAEDGKERWLDGRRHAGGGAVGEVPPAQPFLPAELQPGDQPADRLAARIPGDEPQDPVRQPQERAGRGFSSQTEILCWRARSWATRSSTRWSRAVQRAAVRRDRLHLPAGAGPGALREGLARIRPRRRTRCARARGTSS
jgi:glutamate synthase (NADPH/NADH) large chain